MSFFRHHRHGDNENRKDETPPVYSQHPAGYSPPPPSYTQPPPSYTQPPQTCTQPPPTYSHPQPGYSAPPPAYSQQPYPPTYTQHPPPYSQQPPPAYSPAVPAPSGSYAGSNNNATVRVYTKAGENYSLSIRDGTVVLVPTNPRDEFQHWYKDFRWATQVKDDENLPGFALINKATGLAIKHSLGPTHPVRLVPYNPDYLDESVLWTESHDTGEGFRAIRMVNNTRLNFDAFHGDKNHGGVHDGTTIVLWEWAKGKNQRWKIVPYYCKFSNYISSKVSDSARVAHQLSLILITEPKKRIRCFFYPSVSRIGISPVSERRCFSSYNFMDHGVVFQSLLFFLLLLSSE